MSKFIEVTEGIRKAGFNIERGNTMLLNTDYIRRLEKGSNYTYLYLSNKEDMLTCETYEEVKAMIMYDPAVADIVIKGEGL